ncbi:hypothetical protein C8Q80DRAFT_1100880 [Daedaleopsis nitida]|nr:hypothetical protein C8Q80DRAFT_1100880 [Daedaleopsis nitida]
MPDGVLKDENYWIDDGNVVIIASDTVAFRVYKGLLARTSPIFKDLFTITHRAKDEETMDDTPVVRVTDFPDALGRFLMFLLEPSYDLGKYHTMAQDYGFLAGFTRIAHKYQVDSALAFSTTRLLKFFTPGPGWVDAQSWSNRWASWGHACKVYVGLSDAIDAISLFQLIEAADTLPFALYLCCLCDPVDLRNGVAREDKSLAQVSDEDFARCARATVALSWECHAVVQRTFSPHDRWGDYVWRYTCKDGGKCKDVVVRMSNAQAVDRTAYPLTDLFVRIDQREVVPKAYSTLQYALCAACRGKILEQSVISCRDVLAGLPKFFELEKKAG